MTRRFIKGIYDSTYVKQSTAYLRREFLQTSNYVKKLAPYKYNEVAHTPGLWRHATRPVQFTLVVDSSGVKYVGEENAKHLIQAIRKGGHKLEVD